MLIIVIIIVIVMMMMMMMMMIILRKLANVNEEDAGDELEDFRLPQFSPVFCIDDFYN